MNPSLRVYSSIDSHNEITATHGMLVAQLLHNRGISSIDEAKPFLLPSWEANHNPFLMKNLDEGIKRLKVAIDNNERITIYADYDADGIPGAVALSSLLMKIGHTNYHVYLPHRHDEGYGIHIDALAQEQSAGTSLVISIDVGITAHDAAQWCHEHHLDLIITDHHEPILNPDGSQNLPLPLILINPKQTDCEYPDPMLCGAGVIFKFIQGFLERYRDQYNVHEGWEKWLLDLVGLATLSDMVPLTGENRIFAYYGLEVLRKTKRHGLRLLMNSSGIDPKSFTEEDITFSVTPQINAASRMSHPEDAYLALQASTEAEATTFVAHLKQLNTKRKTLVAQTMKEALGKLRQRKIDQSIVVGSPSWQAGILGLVASKLVEHYHVPTFVWSEEQGAIKGSCRSYDRIDLVKIMNSLPKGTFTQYGGHQEAGGFSCTKESIHFLPEKIATAVIEYKKNVINQKVETFLEVDMILNLDEVTNETYQKIRTLGPFGVGNPKPLFLFKNIIPIQVESFGKEKNHTKLLFKNSRGRIISAIKFFSQVDDFAIKPMTGTAIDLTAHIEQSSFMGKRELRLHLVEIFKTQEK